MKKLSRDENEKYAFIPVKNDKGTDTYYLHSITFWPSLDIPNTKTLPNPNSNFNPNSNPNRNPDPNLNLNPNPRPNSHSDPRPHLSTSTAISSANASCCSFVILKGLLNTIQRIGNSMVTTRGCVAGSKL